MYYLGGVGLAQSLPSGLSASTVDRATASQAAQYQGSPHPPSKKSHQNMTPEEFRKACGYWASGVSIVTTRDVDGKPYGLTMNAVTSLSLDPPMFVICVDNKSDTLEPLKRSGVFCINVLQQDQQPLSNAFARKNPDKFADVAWEAGASGAPLLTGRLMGIECSVSAVHPGGDHHIFVGTVAAITRPSGDDVPPMLYYRGKYASLAS